MALFADSRGKMDLLSSAVVCVITISDADVFNLLRRQVP